MSIDSLALPEYTFASLNRHALTLLPLAQLFSTEPAHVYNMLDFRQVAVKGMNFFDSKELTCLFNG